MNEIEYAEQLLLSGKLENKLFSPEKILFKEPAKALLTAAPSLPQRDRRIAFSEIQAKFPSKGSLHLDENKAKALHFFANHELLAIEMMACALLIYPCDLKLRKMLVKNIRDEQKHLNLYIDRIHELGADFGDFPLNQFFWKQMKNLKTPAHFLSVMALTFEAANLDFASYYQQLFHGHGDKKTASIMGIVLEDELSHVAGGWSFMKQWSQNESVWEYYLKHLPYPLTPNRAKGNLFDRDLRLKAHLDHEFIEHLANYRDDFRITKRKEWND